MQHEQHVLAQQTLVTFDSQTVRTENIAVVGFIIRKRKLKMPLKEMKWKKKEMKEAKYEYERNGWQCYKVYSCMASCQ